MKNSKYLYIFGYNTPIQLRMNDLNGWGDEDSMAVIIYAENEKVAQEWGQDIAIKFNQKLHEDDEFDWLKLQYANFVEEVDKTEYTKESLENIDEVKLGEYPDFEEMLKGIK